MGGAVAPGRQAGDVAPGRQAGDVWLYVWACGVGCLRARAVVAEARGRWGGVDVGSSGRCGSLVRLVLDTYN